MGTSRYEAKAGCSRLTTSISEPQFVWVEKTFYIYRNRILDVKSTFLMHSNLLNVSLVSLCDSFDALTVFVLFKQSIGEGKRGNELAEWHVAWLAE